MTTPGPDASPPPARPPRRWLALLVLFLAAAGVTFAAVKLFLPPPVPAAVVGQWRVVDGELRGATMEFGRDGTFRVTLEEGGESRTVEAAVRGDDKTLQFTWTNPANGTTGVETQAVEHIGPAEMTLKNQGGLTTRLVRLQ